VPHLLVTVAYRPPSIPAPRPPRPAARPAAAPRAQGAENGGGEPVWQSLLTQESARLFETLHAWRTARCRAEAVPPYVILTNLQLARIASEAPRTLAALREVPGLGPSRVERFGAKLLVVVRSGDLPSGAPRAAEPAPEAGPSMPGVEDQRGAEAPA
jgi:superfamily II DNA helicase RecQ